MLSKIIFNALNIKPLVGLFWLVCHNLLRPGCREHRINKIAYGQLQTNRDNNNVISIFKPRISVSPALRGFASTTQVMFPCVFIYVCDRVIEPGSERDVTM